MTDLHAYRLGDHITILSVGVDFETIYLHTNLIPAQTKDWITCHGMINNLIYPLIDESADMLRRYRLFLYTGKIASKDEDVASLHPGDSEWHQLVLMYLFAGKIRDEKFGNVVINALVEKVQDEDTWPTGLAHEVYEETKKGNQLRRLYVDLHIWVGQGMSSTMSLKSEFFADLVAGSGIQAPHDDRKGPTEFLRNVRLGLAVAGERIYDSEAEAPWQKDLCKNYHKHEMTSVCGTEEAEVIDLTEV